MLHIVTGEVNSGKTTLMKKLFLQHAGTADGFLSEKLFHNGNFHGYRLTRLQGTVTMELALLENVFHEQFHEACRLGSFVFSSEAFRFAIDVLTRLSEDPAVGALFLDEFGPLELRGQGFAGILPKLLHSGKELYITMRSACLEEFLKKYMIKEYRLISTPQSYD